MLICLPVNQAHVYDYIIITHFTIVAVCVTIVVCADAVTQVVLPLAIMCEVNQAVTMPQL